MATETSRSPPETADPFGGDWRLGLASGILGGVAFGVVVSVVDPSVLRETIPALYGVTPPGDAVLGWVLHVLHASVLGVVFAAVIGLTDRSGASARDQVGAGILFALVVWVALSVVVLPLWLAVVSPVSVPFPYVSSAMLAGHAVFGVVMGTIYYAFDAPDEDTSNSTISGD
ncbi:histidine kinase [Halorubellus sp. PRR65]|uniref:histidine kinase n=1 Tax=Halorubellus sp. PRR65 TaxID=3098148 RepID=UPI002B25E987|nr:histidine kinase [Halorubellus sp. PRR65]